MVGKWIIFFDRRHNLKHGNSENSGFWRNEIKHGCMVWTPPPGAGLIALEQLRNARLKRQRSMHVVVIPKLMTPEWLKQMYKLADIVMSVPARLDCWGPENYEPLMIAIVFPFLTHSP